jgi:hypothetical protein
MLGGALAGVLGGRLRASTSAQPTPIALPQPAVTAGLRSRSGVGARVKGEVYESDGPVWDEGRVERVRCRRRGTTAGTLRE